MPRRNKQIRHRNGALFMHVFCVIFANFVCFSLMFQISGDCNRGNTQNQVIKTVFTTQTVVESDHQTAQNSNKNMKKKPQTFFVRENRANNLITTIFEFSKTGECQASIHVQRYNT